MWFKSYKHFYYWPWPVGLMLRKAASFKKGCYVCQWLEYVDMHTYAKLVQIFHVVQELWTFSLTANKQTGSHSDNSAHLHVVQCLRQTNFAIQKTVWTQINLIWVHIVCYTDVLFGFNGTHRAADKKLTNIWLIFLVGPLRFFECNCMALGLTNAPATFQWLMEQYMGEPHMKESLIYLDDIIIFSKSYNTMSTVSVWKMSSDSLIKMS